MNDTANKLKDQEIPFFPSCLYEKQENVSVWWFEKNFSQSFYGTMASRQCNSCMLIMLLVAARIRIYKTEIKANNDQLPFNLIKIFAESILEGNEIYCNMIKANKLQDINLSIPDAIHAVCSKGLKEWFYATIHLLDYENGIRNSIHTGLTEGYRRWQRYNSIRKTENFLFALLIASKQSILFVFEESTSTVTLFDSHEHPPNGSVVAQAEIKSLHSLCLYIERMYFNDYESCPDLMELSFLECNKQNPLVYIRKFIRFVD